MATHETASEVKNKDNSRCNSPAIEIPNMGTIEAVPALAVLLLKYCLKYLSSDSREREK